MPLKKIRCEAREEVLILKNRKKKSRKKKWNSNPNSSCWPNNLQRNPYGSLKGGAIPTLGAQLTNLTAIKLSRRANNLCIVCFVRFIQSSYLSPILTQIWLTTFQGLLRRSWFAKWCHCSLIWMEVWMLDLLWHWVLRVLWLTHLVLADLSEMVQWRTVPTKCRKTENERKSFQQIYHKFKTVGVRRKFKHWRTITILQCTMWSSRRKIIKFRFKTEREIQNCETVL